MRPLSPIARLAPGSHPESSESSGLIGLVAPAAARLVRIGIADLHLVAAPGDALAVVGGRAAAHADRMHLVDVLGQRHDAGHRPERAAQVVLIQSGDQHSHAAVGEVANQPCQPIVEELRFVDAHYVHPRLQAPAQLGAVGHRLGRYLALVAGHQPLGVVALVQPRLEHLDFLARDHRAPQPAQQLFALAGEHAAGDDLDMSAPTLGARCLVHASSPRAAFWAWRGIGIGVLRSSTCTYTTSASVTLTWRGSRSRRSASTTTWTVIEVVPTRSTSA